MNRLVAASLRQPLLVLLMTAVLIGVGVWSLNRLPVDAYPDLSPPIVEIITQWPGHAAEEVERLITVPVELGMNGVPRTANARSISLYGLSDVILTFSDGTDKYFARQEVFNRLAGLSLPNGVTPSVSPLSSPSGLIYRYVLQSPDRSPMELKTFEDWVVEPAYRSGPRRGRRFRLRRRRHAVPGAVRPGQAGRRRPLRAAGRDRPGGQQRQRRRRLLFAGRPVLLRARGWGA